MVWRREENWWAVEGGREYASGSSSLSVLRILRGPERMVGQWSARTPPMPRVSMKWWTVSSTKVVPLRSLSASDRRAMEIIDMSVSRAQRPKAGVQFEAVMSVRTERSWEVARAWW